MQNVNIVVNKNMVPGDKSAFIPNGLRVGTPCMTSRGFTEKDFVGVVDLIDEAVNLAKDLRSEFKANGKGDKLADFMRETNNLKHSDDRFSNLKNRVINYVKDFPFSYE